MKRLIKRRRPSFILLSSLLLLASPGLVLAQTSDPASTITAAAALPPWDNLTPAQRELLVAPIRERWNTNADSRARIYQHALRWQQMPPGQRERARHGMRRWEHMDPGKRTEMRALFHQMRGMTTEQRDALRQQWHGMSDAQRRAWVQAHPPGQD